MNVLFISEIIYDLILYFNDEVIVNKDIVSVLYFGIVGDIGWFFFNNILEYIMEIVGKLIGYDIDYNVFLNKMMEKDLKMLLF